VATKSTGVGRGGARPGAGRKPKPAHAPTPDTLAAAEALLSDKSVEQLMEIAVRFAAADGRWDEVSKRGARLLAAQARKPASADKAAAPATPSRFAPRPAPGSVRPN
jgi:hypothetical protein